MNMDTVIASHPRSWALLAAFGLALSALPVLADNPPSSDEFFEKEIRPLLADNCFSCHNEQKVKGGLKLTSRADMLRGGDSGPTLVLGQPAESLLVQAVRHQADLHMPPKGRLKEAQVDALVRWVKLGAPWPGADDTKVVPAERPFRISDEQKRHWAFQPVRAIQPPGIAAASPIDQFLVAAMQARGLRPVPLADKITLVRRATYDLTGLPPTPQEVENFLGDQSAEAFAKVVDRLLASPHYAERWGRHWLDVVRYADTAGETADFPVPQAWRYRNYVIDAFNRDKPYDAFVREQIAGDILASRLPADTSRDRYAELIVATGYISISRRFGCNTTDDRHLTIDDTLDTLGKSILGVTIACARCHDHKYDPISAADYYALYGIFDSTRYPFPGCEPNKVPKDLVTLLPPAEQEKFVREIVKPFEAELARLDKEIRDQEAARHATEKELKELPATEEAKDQRTEVQAKLAALTGELNQKRSQRNSLAARPPNIELAYAVDEQAGHHTRIHRRGDPQTPGEVVPRRFLQVLGGQTVPANAGSGRLQLGDWLTDAANPLTARVMINRIWQGHFGVGLVKTPNDFGTRGERPTHPELLDYLAARFVQSGWSIKAMHRLIMLTDAYQRGSNQDAACALSDPGNSLLWRFNRRRLDAEEIRDSLLAVSGDLDTTPGGSHPFPPEKSWGFTQHAPFSAVYDNNRRSVYLMTQRIKRHPFLALFDGPDTSASTGSRYTTTVPTQALFFLNDPFVHKSSARLADRLLKESEEKVSLDRATGLLYGRPPRPVEVAAAARFTEGYAQELAGKSDQEKLRTAWAAWLRIMLCSNEFVYVD